MKKVDRVFMGRQNDGNGYPDRCLDDYYKYPQRHNDIRLIIVISHIKKFTGLSLYSVNFLEIANNYIDEL